MLKPSYSVWKEVFLGREQEIKPLIPRPFYRASPFWASLGGGGGGGGVKRRGSEPRKKTEKWKNKNKNKKFVGETGKTLSRSCFTSSINVYEVAPAACTERNEFKCKQCYKLEPKFELG